MLWSPPPTRRSWWVRTVPHATTAATSPPLRRRRPVTGRSGTRTGPRYRRVSLTEVRKRSGIATELTSGYASPMYSAFYRRCFQIVTAAVLAYGLYELLYPLRNIIGWAMVLAFILYPLQERLSRRLKGRTALAAALITAL